MSQLRPLGNSGIRIVPLVFGGNVFGWTIDQARSFEMLDAYLAAGFTAIDTADVYSRWLPGNKGGESETILGHWFKARNNRSQVVLMTKVGSDMGDGKTGLKKDYILRAVEDSLRRLQTDYIDLYQSHRDDETTPIEEPLEAYATLLKQGKIRAIGASNFSAARLSQALAASAQKNLPRYECLQPLYNLFDRAPYEDALEAVCQKNGIGVIPYFSLASGFLTGKYRSEADIAGKMRGERVRKYLIPRGMKILAAVDAVAKNHPGSNPAQVALAWMIARPGITAPIASATTLDQLKDLVAATTLSLDGTSLATLNNASAA